MPGCEWSLAAIYNPPSASAVKKANLLLDFLGDLRRTHMCGVLRSSDAGKKAVLMGWVNRRRDLGNLVFIDVRDRTGLTQVVCNKELNPAIHEKASRLRNEYVIAAIGRVKQREPNTINKNIATGEIELVAEELRILNEAKQPPFLPGDTVLPNEELRADRQPEFSQIDLEMSYPQPERVWEVVEGFLSAAFKAAGYEIKTPFPRMSYDDAIRLYGSDKPDMRLPAMNDVREAFKAENLEALAVNPNLPVMAIRIPKVGELSRKERDEIKPLFTGKGNAKLFEDFKRLEKSFPDSAAKIRAKNSAETDDLIVIVAGDGKLAEHPSEGGVKPEVKQHDHAVYTAAGLLRVALAQKYASRHRLFEKTGNASVDFRFLWVTDFPMFEWDEEGKRWAAAHHPFTSPHERDMDKLESGPSSPELGAVRALAYDVVLNGTELGSGSIRIHRQDIQSKIFHALGMTEEEARSRFGFFLEALEYGTPPHGGIALGLDRIVMILAGADSLREVIPFPKTARAVDLMVDAPTPVSEAQLKELGIAIRKAQE